MEAPCGHDVPDIALLKSRSTATRSCKSCGITWTVVQENGVVLRWGAWPNSKPVVGKPAGPMARRML